MQGQSPLNVANLTRNMGYCRPNIVYLTHRISRLATQKTPIGQRSASVGHVFSLKKTDDPREEALETGH